MAALVWSALLGATADGCDVPTPGERNSELARAYVEIGEEELSAGRVDSARAAFRAALSHDEALTAARTGLARACAKPATTQKSVLAEAMARMSRRDWRGALEALDGADPHDRSAALLAGVCHFELGDDERARQWLLRARDEPSHASPANLLLGLLALREGDSARAAAHLDRIDAPFDSRLSTAMGELRRSAHRDGRVSIVAALEAGYDGNAELSPDVASPDASVALEAGVALKPLGQTGPFARARGQYRKLARSSRFDSGLADVAAGYAFSGRRLVASAGYGFDASWISAALHRSAHRLEASGRALLSPWVLTVGYVGRLQRFTHEDLQGYSGLHHAAVASVDVFAGRASFGAGYRFGRDLAADTAFAHVEHAAFLRVRLDAAENLSLELFAQGANREYDATDPWLALRRSDWTVEAAALARYELANRWTLQLLLGGQRAQSSAAAFSFTRLTATAGVVYSMGVL